jgi:hypothetical protein
MWSANRFFQYRCSGPPSLSASGSSIPRAVFPSGGETRARTVLEEFARIQSGDVVLPTRTAEGRPGRTVRLRCVTAPDEGQKVLLGRLGLTLPQRLRRVDEVAKCSEDFSP